MTVETNNIRYEVDRWLAKYDEADEPRRRELFRMVAVSAEHWFECNSAKAIPRRWKSTDSSALSE